MGAHAALRRRAAGAGAAAGQPVLGLARQRSALQARGGRAQVMDGSFADAKEMVGGFFLTDCDSRAGALDIAARCPAAQWATVEVRALGPCFDDAIK
nr:YciI family protein [Azohydromonas australica]